MLGNLIRRSDTSNTERPSILQIADVNVIERDSKSTYVEICVEVKTGKNSAGHVKTERVTIEFYPHEPGYDIKMYRVSKLPAKVKVLQEENLTDSRTKRLELFGAVIGRLTYYGS